MECKRLMHYHTTFRPNPTPRNARKLKNYVAGNAELVVDSVGQQPTDEQLEQFVRSAAGSGETRQHTISLMSAYPPEKLAEWGRKVADESLDGEYVIGVHNEGAVAAHIHIAEFFDEARGTDFAISDVRESLEKYIDDPPAW